MSMAAHRMPVLYRRFIGGLIERNLLNALPIVIHYVDKDAPAPTFDPNVESTYPAKEEKTVEVTGLVHVVSARSVQRQFAEIQAGDAIVTFEDKIRNNAITFDPEDPDANVVDLSAMEQISFVLAGDKYVQQTVGKDLAKYWSVILGGDLIAQTMLLRLSN